MKEKFKGFIIGFIVALTLMSTGILATNGTITKDLWYNNIKITFNEKELIPTDVNGTYVEPFIIDGTTYLPVRAIATALELNVTWDETTNTVNLYDSAFITQINKKGQAIIDTKQIAKKYATVFPNMVKHILINDFSYTNTEAEYAIYNSDIDWNYYAEIHALEYILICQDEDKIISLDDILTYLSTEKGYLHEQLQFVSKSTSVLNRLNQQKQTSKENDTEIRDEFKSAMDSYEQFFDEYISIIKKYKNNPSDINILTDYIKYIEQYNKMMEEFENLKYEDMNISETTYYIEVQNRINQKLIEVAQ